MKLALQRSITFWSGILAMVFICWAWWDSMHYRSVFAWGSFSGGSGGGGAALVRCTDRLGLTIPGPAKLTGERGEFSPNPGIKIPALPEPLLLRGGNDDLSTVMGRIGKNRPTTYQDELKLWMSYQALGDWLVFVPYWLSLIAVAILWTGLLIWRAERRMRAAMPLTK